MPANLPRPLDLVRGPRAIKKAGVWATWVNVGVQLRCVHQWIPLGHHLRGFPGWECEWSLLGGSLRGASQSEAVHGRKAGRVQLEEGDEYCVVLGCSELRLQDPPHNQAGQRTRDAGGRRRLGQTQSHQAEQLHGRVSGLPDLDLQELPAEGVPRWHQIVVRVVRKEGSALRVYVQRQWDHQRELSGGHQ